MTNNIKDLEKTLWAAADKMRGNVAVTDYKYVVCNDDPQLAADMIALIIKRHMLNDIQE